MTADSLPRNCCLDFLDDLSGRTVDEIESEMGGALWKPADDVPAVLTVTWTNSDQTHPHYNAYAARDAENLPHVPFSVSINRGFPVRDDSP